MNEISPWENLDEGKLSWQLSRTTLNIWEVVGKVERPYVPHSTKKIGNTGKVESAYKPKGVPSGRSLSGFQ